MVWPKSMLYAVHTRDNTRMDLTIPRQQHFYLRAINAEERQKWLVALGSAKACLMDRRMKKEKEYIENTETLKNKMSELKTYCDCLIQHANKMSESAAAGTLYAEEKIDAKSLLKSTCKAFLKTLEECMLMANATFASELFEPSPAESPPVAPVKPMKAQHHASSSHSKAERHLELNNNHEHGPGIEVVKCQERIPIKDDDEQADKLERNNVETINNTYYEDAESRRTSEDSSSMPEERLPSGSLQLAAEMQDSVMLQEEEEEEEEELETFFSLMSHRFCDIRLEEDNFIPTEYFLESCYAIVPVLDKLGPTVFAPVKMDFVGNIKKINQKYITDKEKFTTLQKIVLDDVERHLAHIRNSATEALLWLKRGLKFLKEFLEEVKNGEVNIQEALNNAYGRTLRQYHGWVVRGVFALALRASPTYENFIAALTVNEGDEQKASFYRTMQRDLGIYLPAMENLLVILDDFYDQYNLESEEVV
ncbi:pleckstrin homology domain-containing family A member 8 isoform X2 [Protopterus annectens]|uniref:pleckstrin homology domain-containing family A member 8 isoform X2 n=1 Tax=Protopterus annectens TaxID=7888 RepID=UPI001CFC369B|nr:pleckstrin homology domain-containing family A member 8 isoform X2 [Protopterus annectens]